MKSLRNCVSTLLRILFTGGSLICCFAWSLKIVDLRWSFEENIEKGKEHHKHIIETTNILKENL